MWTLGTTETLIIDMKKKYYKNQKRKVIEEKRLNSLKYIIKKQGNMKRREYKINRYERLSTGKMKKVDSEVVFTMSKEEAIRIGLIRVKKK